MSDYFALLDQPRRPWLDPEQLKQTFHERTLQSHPDAQNEQPGAFTEINEAYQVLRDPKRRLQHLLTLQGDAPSTRMASIPKDIEELFSTVAALTREADVVIAKVANATTTLKRSLLRAEVVQLEQRLKQTLETMARLHDNALARLKDINPNDSAELHALYLLFSYLPRWMRELEERHLQLTLRNLSS